MTNRNLSKRNNLARTLLTLFVVLIVSACASKPQELSDNEKLSNLFVEDGFTTEETERGVVVYLPAFFFEYGSSDLKQESRERIRYISDAVNLEFVQDRKIAVEGRIDETKIPELCESTLIVLQAANVNSGAFDKFESICTKARKAGSWVHIDGAFGLWAAGSEKLKHLIRGAELANSWSLDAHKTLNAPYDSGIVMCDDKDALVNALHASGSYIVYGENRDGMLYTPEMSRRARSVELWATLKYLGKEGVDELVTGLHLRAVQAAEELKIAGFSILNDVCFNQVLIAGDNEDQTQKVMKSVQNDGICWVGGSKWQGRSVIRLSVCSWATTPEDISMSVRSFHKSRQRILDDI